jgi:hypothetical protein
MIKASRTGKLEYWNNGILGFEWIEECLVFPLFHPSNIPSFYCPKES